MARAPYEMIHTASLCYIELLDYFGIEVFALPNCSSSYYRELKNVCVLDKAKDQVLVSSIENDLLAQAKSFVENFPGQMVKGNFLTLHLKPEHEVIVAEIVELWCQYNSWVEMHKD